VSARLKVAVLVSGRGSNLQSLIDAAQQPDYPAEIALVISNIPDVFALERAVKADIPAIVVPHRTYASRAAFDSALDERLRAAGIEFICLAGFMRILSDDFVRGWEGRLVNIHPSLLPAFRGLHVHEQALAAKVKVSGCTVHYVIPELDAGPIVAQAEVPVRDGDTPESLAARILEAEHRLYPAALAAIARGEVALEAGKIIRRSRAR
jgi:phosphoribosylglycinamide formyltransferase-1